ncbi:universal stress protein [Halalkalicoccus subterraneus]|uniref:universal stress protein n=1 Tax=Halalkalicoccus subterraneus TaxID=2675002 RepID=UPI000EFCF960|nr:universal stress protein [Halalkalicoccus subterraneus]
MGTILVAYGKDPHRNTVLEFAVERAAAANDDLFVYHINEPEDNSPDQVRGEIEQVLQQTAPTVEFEIAIEELGTVQEKFEHSKVSKQKQLVDIIESSDRDYEYLVMGNIERGPIEEFFLSSMSEAVLDTYAIPVMLVPISTT